MQSSLVTRDYSKIPISAERAAVIDAIQEEFGGWTLLCFGTADKINLRFRDDVTWHGWIRVDAADSEAGLPNGAILSSAT